MRAALSCTQRQPRLLPQACAMPRARALQQRAHPRLLTIACPPRVLACCACCAQDGQSVTLEPGGQFELSGATLDTLHKTCAEVNSHLYQVCEGRFWAARTRM